jgi:predicted DNA binding CopG/RHH family protein
VRSSINEENEKEMSQLFFVVAFDFFGLKKHRNMRLIKSIWQKIHNRVSANVLNRIKLICETKFNSISAS